MNRSIEKNQLLKPIEMAIIILLVFLGYNYLGSIVLFALGCVLLTGWCIAGNVNDVFLSLVVMVPNMMMIKYLNSEFAILGYVILIFEWRYLLLIYKKEKKIIVTIESICFGFFALITFSLTMSASYLASAIRVVSFSIFIYEFLKNSKNKNKGLSDGIILCFCFGVAMSVVLGIVFWIATGQNVFIGYFSGIRNDRNYFSSTVSLGIAVATMYYKTSLHKRYTRWCTVLLVVMLAGGLLSGSRTFVASLLISVIILFYNSLSIKQFKRLLTLIVVFFILMMIIGDNQNILANIQNTLARFSDNDVKSGNGRFDIWKIYLGDFTGSLIGFLFGRGTESAIRRMMPDFMATHNTVIQGLYCGGLTGFLAYIGIYLKIFHKMSQHRHVRIIEMLPIVDVLLCRFFVASYMSDAVSFEILVAIVTATYRITGENNEYSSNKYNLWSGKHRKNCCFD